MNIKYIMYLGSLLVSFHMLGQEVVCGCCTEDHKAFDFWLGTWEVTNKDGSLAGTNTIRKLEDGCLVSEQWLSANGSNTGRSTNFYNRQTKQWEQLWIDNAGNHLKLKGNREGNQMILLSDPFVKDNKTYRNRIIWTLNADGSIRQLWEVLQKETVVHIAFDGLYRKKK